MTQIFRRLGSFFLLLLLVGGPALALAGCESVGGERVAPAEAPTPAVTEEPQAEPEPEPVPETRPVRLPLG